MHDFEFWEKTAAKIIGGGKLHRQHFSCRPSVAAAVARWVLQRVLQLTAANPAPLREGHVGRGLLPVPLCALLRHAGVGSREQVQPPLPLPRRRSS